MERRRLERRWLERRWLERRWLERRRLERQRLERQRLERQRLRLERQCSMGGGRPAVAPAFLLGVRQWHAPMERQRPAPRGRPRCQRPAVAERRAWCEERPTPGRGGFSEEQHDLSEDLGERVNLAAERPGVVTALREAHAGWRARMTEDG